jgi:O-antigen/teichoic acid export membrane protein
MRARSLLENSLSSVLASGILIFSTLLIPAILMRTINQREYAVYSTVLAALPLILTIPQAMRTVAASQLSLAFSQSDQIRAKSSYIIFNLGLILANTIASLVAIEIYLALQKTYKAEVSELRFGLYCITGYVSGFAAATIVTGIAAAYRNFVPDNISKFWPGTFQLIGVTLIWIAAIKFPLSCIFVIYLLSSWSVAVLLLVQYRRPVLADVRWERDKLTERGLITGLRGVTWWNLMAYLATTAAVMVVAIGHPAHIVPFSIATSLLGVTSAGLIAVANPLSGHAAALFGQDRDRLRPFFLRINTLFQLYIMIVAAGVCLMPERFFALWLTPSVAGEVRTFALYLLPSYVLRLLTMAYTLFVMASGRQHQLWLTPLIEAIMSVSGAILLGTWLGVVGVPVALALSALTRLMLTIFYDERFHNAALGLRRIDLLLSAFRLRSYR